MPLLIMTGASGSGKTAIRNADWQSCFPRDRLGRLSNQYYPEPRRSRQVRDQPGLHEKPRGNGAPARLFGQAGSGQKTPITGADTILRPIRGNILFSSSGENTFSPSSRKAVSPSSR